MKVLPITVLFHEGPMGRAYLESLRRAGFKAARIIHMLPRPGMFARFLPSGMRWRMLANRQEKLANHWPRVLAGQFPGLYRDMTGKIESTFDLGLGFIDSIRSGEDVAAYGENLEYLELDGLRDPALVKFLAAKVRGVVLFTGGGILPPGLFEVPEIVFLHVHPGFLPFVRGADGLLWSTLVRGRPGVSAFVMAPGLDVGDLLAAMETPPLEFEIPTGEAPGDRDLYRAIFSFYDPMLRVHALKAVLPGLLSTSALKGTPQDISVGETFHFMESRIRHEALKLLFGRADAVQV